MTSKSSNQSQYTSNINLLRGFGMTSSSPQNVQQQQGRHSNIMPPNRYIGYSNTDASKFHLTKTQPPAHNAASVTNTNPNLYSSDAATTDKEAHIISNEENNITYTQSQANSNFGFNNKNSILNPSSINNSSINRSQMMENLKSMHIQTSSLLKNEDLNGYLRDTLSNIFDELDRSIRFIEKEFCLEEDKRDNISALLDCENLLQRMDSNAPMVRAYRARASTNSLFLQQKTFLFNDQHMPKYISNSPLPLPNPNLSNTNRSNGSNSNIPTTTDLTVKTQSQSQLTYSNNGVLCQILFDLIDSSKPSISVRFTENDTATSLINHIIEKYSSRLPFLSQKFDYVFKAIGSNEQMYGNSTKLYEYDYIRSKLRHNRKISLCFLQKPSSPNPATLSEQFQQALLSYSSKIKPSDIQNILHVDDYPDFNSSSSKNQYDMKQISFRALHRPYKIRIQGLDGLSKKECDDYIEASGKVFIRTFLFYGTKIVPNSIQETAHHVGSQSMVWNQQLSSGSARPTDNSNSNGDGPGIYSSQAKVPDGLSRYASIPGQHQLDDKSVSPPSTPSSSKIDRQSSVKLSRMTSSRFGFKQSKQSSSNSSGKTIKQGNSQIRIDSLPRATRIAFLLFQESSNVDRPNLLAQVVTNLIDEVGKMKTGRHTFEMWSASDYGPPSQLVNQSYDTSFTNTLTNWLFRAPTLCNRVRNKFNNVIHISLTVEFEEFILPVMAPVTDSCIRSEEGEDSGDSSRLNGKTEFSDINAEDKKRLKQICYYDLLHKLSDSDKELLWKYRHHLTKDASNLSKFLSSVDQMSRQCVDEVHKLLLTQSQPKDPILALDLLDIRHHDYTVREYAVDCLKTITDCDLQLFLLQLIQILKFEPYHDSPLCRFLIERALRNPLSIGHYLFQHLKAEIHIPLYTERFVLILEDYLCHVGRHSLDLRKQLTTVNKLQMIAETVSTSINKFKTAEETCVRNYKNDLTTLNKNYFSSLESNKFQMILDPRIESSTLIIEKCRYMSSKKVPLQLVFKNSDVLGSDNVVIFKSGDDLRQDILTLQLLRIMDKIWLSEGLDMKMLPYNCIATGVNENGEGVGMIEVVLDSDTTSKIQLSHGGLAVGAFKTTTLDNYLRQHNKTEEAYARAQQNFVASCAGYCVATYILGIGDRHNDNIMLTKDGHLFHIDFGHFLGNFKSKMGINRERCPFVFTPEMAYVMGGKKYRKHELFDSFKTLCSRAFNVLRNHGPLFIDLFNLMVAAEMPELMSTNDINYLREMLHLDKDEKAAETIFRKEIKNSLNSMSRQLDNLIHNWKHNI